MSRFLFITDLHGMLSCESRVDMPLEALTRKLSWCIEWCNQHEASLILGGDIFDRPSVPHEVSNVLRDVLRGCRLPVYAVWGNHDLMYRQTSYKSKCALYGFRDFVHFVDETPVEGEDFYLTGIFPQVVHPKLVLYVGHAFLDIQDGTYTVSRIDIGGYAGRMICILGHDHMVYAPEQCGSSVILRPGSLFRCRRSPSEIRDFVCGYSIDTTTGVYTCVQVPCSPAAAVFKDAVGATDTTNVINLDSVFSILHTESEGAGLTFEGALRQVTTEDVASYVMSKL